MQKLTGKVKLTMIAWLAVVVAGAGVALTAMAQGEGRKQEEQARYRSSVQVQDDKNEQEEAGEVERAEGAEGNEASEANEANESEAGEAGEDGEEAEDRAEGAESERLRSLARITPDQASAAALAQVPGTVKKAELENEDGNVVYGVEVKTANGVAMSRLTPVTVACCTSSMTAKTINIVCESQGSSKRGERHGEAKSFDSSCRSSRKFDFGD